MRVVHSRIRIQGIPFERFRHQFHSMTNTDTPRPPKSAFSRRVWLACGIVALVAIVFLLFKTLFSLVLLILASVLLAIYFHGFAHLLQKIKIPAKASVPVSVVFNLLLIVAFFWFVGARLEQQVAQLSDTLPKTIQTAQQKLTESPVGSKVVSYLQSSGNNKKTMAAVKQFFSSSFGILSDLYIILLMGLFFTASPSIYTNGIVSLMPTANAKDKTKQLFGEWYTILKKWLVSQIIGIVFIGVLTGVGLLIVGVPLVFTLALIAGLLNFVPNFGPIIAFIPAGLIGLLQGTDTVLWIAGIYVFVQIVQSAVQQPLVQKKLVNLPPALTIIAQVAFGALGGFWGVLLASPIVAIITVVVNRLYLEKSSTA